ncbi:MAG: hypothetical protein M3P70_09895 [Actinomycetota bacterium]|nr:hypothetical protein [Actinomycetota bacterium]
MAERPPVVLRKGQGKDGNPSVPYVRDHPTNYVWRADLERLTARLVNMDPFYRRIWVNTYFIHPPGVAPPPRDTVSFDVWGFGGRGTPLEVNLGWQVYRTLFDDPKLPNINWIIWQGRMWTRTGGPGPAPPGPPGSDAGHFNHIHVTYL